MGVSSVAFGNLHAELVFETFHHKTGWDGLGMMRAELEEHLGRAQRAACVNGQRSEKREGGVGGREEEWDIWRPSSKEKAVFQKERGRGGRLR